MDHGLTFAWLWFFPGTIFELTRLGTYQCFHGQLSTIGLRKLILNIDHETIESNLFEMEWPPKSGKRQSFPEVDRAAWFTLDEAKEKINAGQAGLIEDFVMIQKKL